MNEFKQQLAAQVANRVFKEQEVVGISVRITELIGVSPEDLKHYHEDPRIHVGHYDIVKTTRIFAQGWVDLWEIVQRGESNWNPAWSEFHGTATINLPPQQVVNHVFNCLRNAKPLQLTAPEPKLADHYRRFEYHNIQKESSGCFSMLIFVLITILCLFI